MSGRLKAGLAFLTIGLLVGLLLARKQDPPARSAARPTGLVARELRLTDPVSSASILLAPSVEGTPGMWMDKGPGRGSLQVGVHGNGFPYALVSDAAVRNFALMRVDGKNASPILVFRSDDVVRMVFGLSMTEPGQPAFLVRYTGDGKKHDVLGRYCDDPDRVCTE